MTNDSRRPRPLFNPWIEENKAQHARIRELEREIERLKRLPPEERVPKRVLPTDGVVYMLRVGGLVKIGWTSDLERRMREYQPDSVLLATKPGTRKDERALHRKHAHLRTHGREWYPLAPQITEEADRIVKEHGAPPVVDFSARRAQRIVGPRLNTGGPKPRTWGHVR